MGTPLYMSPEQVEGKPLDCRSDIYSLGATCYQMLSGNPPFVGETALGVAVQHLKKEPRPLESLRPDLPPAVCRVVHKMLAKDLASRWQSPQELLRELRRVQQEHCPEGGGDFGEWAAAASLPAGPRLEVTRQLAAVMTAAGGETSRRRPWAAVACLAAALAVGGGTARLVMRQEPLLVASDSGHVRIPRQSTALRQYFCASQIGSEEAWRSVIEYFPEKQSVVRRAKQQLARIALHQRNDAQAMALFDELAAFPDEDKEFRAFGLAGKVGLLTLQGKYEESAKVLDEPAPYPRRTPRRADAEDARLRDQGEPRQARPAKPRPMGQVAAKRVPGRRVRRPADAVDGKMTAGVEFAAYNARTTMADRWILAGAILLTLAASQGAAADWIELLPGQDLSAWRQPRGDWAVAGEVRQDPKNSQRLTWKAGAGVAVNGPKGRTTNLATVRKFGDIEAHVEFMIPSRSNSGVYFQGRYELQVYDSYGVAKDQYPGIECGGLYPRWRDNHEESKATLRA